MTAAKEVVFCSVFVFLFVSVCLSVCPSVRLSVCLSVCQQLRVKTSDQILVKILPGMCRQTRTDSH